MTESIQDSYFHEHNDHVSARGMIQQHVACEIDAKEIAEIVLFDW